MTTFLLNLAGKQFSNRSCDHVARQFFSLAGKLNLRAGHVAMSHNVNFSARFNGKIEFA